MPQMKPIMWLYLFIFFSINIMMFNIMNYYIFYNNNPLTMINNKNETKFYTWKW